MSKQMTLGGQRLGAGNKMSVNLHGYDRSTFNLSRAFRSTMSCGTLVPFYCNIAMNGDSFDIDLKHIIKTLPTNGPLLGSFKCQMDFFTIPIRLYNGLLHNNALGIGLKMADVKLPKIKIKQKINSAMELSEAWQQINPSSLLAYLGVRGLGSVNMNSMKDSTITRKFNAVPILGYYDIFKNYYSNKQEENFYLVTTTNRKLFQDPRIITLQKWLGDNLQGEDILTPSEDNLELLNKNLYEFPTNFTGEEYGFTNGKIVINFGFDEETDANQFYTAMKAGEFGINIMNIDGDVTEPFSYANNQIKMNSLFDIEIPTYDFNVTHKKFWNVRCVWNFATNPEIELYSGDKMLLQELIQMPDNQWVRIKGIQNIGTGLQRNITTLKAFPLKEIDDTREDILSRVKNAMGVTTYLNDLNQGYLKTLTNQFGIGYNANTYAQNGLAVKTYLSDIFNNWLNTEVIDGANGISQITRVSTIDGGFTIDALNLAQKVYNLLNRIAVSDGSYDDWQEVVWDVETIRKAESPIYIGGYSTEITFEELVSTARANDEPLGELGGKGRTVGDKGGQINVKIKEPSFIMGIVSITPRIDYSQGNRFYMTELDSLDDLHKPALDGIGFQDLMTERMCATDTKFSLEGPGYFEKDVEQNAVGKQPAWIDWQTDYNETFGQFAIPNQQMFMTLNRQYETNDLGQLIDATTYIDPSKYNYAFADKALESQNFWIQIGMGITARRKMSAKIIPNI